MSQRKDEKITAAEELEKHPAQPAETHCARPAWSVTPPSRQGSCARTRPPQSPSRGDRVCLRSWAVEFCLWATVEPFPGAVPIPGRWRHRGLGSALRGFGSSEGEREPLFKELNDQASEATGSRTTEASCI